MNASGNQKSSTTAIAVATDQQTDPKRDKSQDGKGDHASKIGGRVRIRLGIGKQNSKSSETSATKNQTETVQRIKTSVVDQTDGQCKEDLTVNYCHLRRITRRSQKSIQSVGNEEEEYTSSMTSTDENQGTTNSSTNSDTNNTHESAVVATSQNCTATILSNNVSSNSSSNPEAPRRCKRRKGETSESSTFEHESLLNYQNYKLPNQNSFQLYRNIRKQVDKKLKNLSCVHPKTPHGFRDYVLSRGTYLLDGNKLGNGTNIYMNEDDVLHATSMGKYHSFRNTRTNYSIPNRAKVPLGLPINSPLYNLFIDQEKERHKMRMQHIKEREKLTIAAEQEIMRVHNQAAMAAANQIEPFSACTLLKHQEIYNYLDSEGFTILASDDAQMQGQTKQGENCYEQLSPLPRRGTNSNECSRSDTTRRCSNTSPREASQEAPNLPKPILDEHVSDPKTKDTPMEVETAIQPAEKPSDVEMKGLESECTDPSPTEAENKSSLEEKATEDKDTLTNTGKQSHDSPEASVAETLGSGVTEENVEQKQSMGAVPIETELIQTSDSNKNDKSDSEIPTSALEKLEAQQIKEEDGENSQSLHLPTSVENNNCEKDHDPLVDSERADQTAQGDEIMSDEERRAYNKKIFLSQLQDIDDKWEKIRSEMLIRHRNEAESLYAVQRLEWEWKTKEIGACDVRMTPVIDNTLVPKLNIYSQDY